MTPRGRAGGTGELRGDDERLKLLEENASLKRHNLEQGEKMRQLGVQVPSDGWGMVGSPSRACRSVRSSHMPR